MLLKLDVCVFCLTKLFNNPQSNPYDDQKRNVHKAPIETVY